MRHGRRRPTRRLVFGRYEHPRDETVDGDHENKECEEDLGRESRVSSNRFCQAHVEHGDHGSCLFLILGFRTR